MTEDGPLLDCLLCQRSEIIAKLKSQLAATEQQAGNVLARIHRDGGHYITQHGWEKACVDADAVVCRLQAQLAASDGRVMVAETMLADFYHRAKDCDKDSRSPVDSVPPIVVVRHIVWQYETTFRKATDAAKAMEGNQ